MKRRGPTIRTNPVTIRGNGPRVYQGVRRVDLASSAPFHGGGSGGGGHHGGHHGSHGHRRNFFGWGFTNYVPVFVPIATASCGTPIVEPDVIIDARWAIDCFWPTYLDARAMWGPNATAVVGEILLALAPGTALALPRTGAEIELRRRIELAVAVLMGQEGIPVAFPPRTSVPRPFQATQIRVPWIRALVTGAI